MNFKTTLALVIIAAAVGVFFYFQANAPAPPEQTSVGDQPGDALFNRSTITPAKVDRIELTRGEQSLAFEPMADGEQWRQVQPVSFPVKPAEMRSLIETAGSLRVLEQFKPGQTDNPTLEQTGLAEPQAVLRLVTGEQAHEFRLGRVIGAQAYLQLDDENGVRVVDSQLHDALFGPSLSDWRQTQLATPAPGAIERITIDRNESPVTLTRRDGQWYLDEQSLQRAGADAVEGLIAGLSQLRAGEFVSDDPTALSRFGLADPPLTLTLETATGSGNETRRFVLRRGNAGLDGQQYYATWSTDGSASPVVFTVNQSMIQPFAASPDDLRDPALLAIDAGEIGSLSLRRRDRPDLGLIRDADGFSFVQPGPGFDAGYQTVSEFLQQIVGLRASGYVHDYQPEGEPEMILELTSLAGDAAERIRLYPDPDGGESDLIALRGEETIGYRLASDDVQPLRRSALSLRQRTLLDLVTIDPTTLTLTRSDGATYKFRQQPENRWSLVGAELFESTAFGRLRAALSPLLAESWASADGELETGNQTLTLRIEGSDETPRTLSVNPENRRGQLTGLAGVFVLSPTMVDRLTMEYRSRGVLPTTADQITSVTEQRPGADPRTIESGDQGASVIFDRLTGLSVQRWQPGGEPELEQPAVTYTIKTIPGETYTLSLAEPGDRGTTAGTIDGRRFTIESQSANQLINPGGGSQGASPQQMRFPTGR